MPLDRPVADILTESGREWTREPPATEDEIAALRAAAPFELPPEYVDLLRFCNGGFGELDAPPLLFGLDSVAASIEYNGLDCRRDEFPEHWFFGGNGGLEMIAFDLRQGPPWKIVMIDPIAGPDSAQVIASSMADFIPKIGLREDRARP